MAAAAAAKSLQTYPTLCDPTDGSPPGSSIPGFLQARILEWVAISFSIPKGTTWVNLKNYRMISIHFQGKPFNIIVIQVYAPTTNAEEAEILYQYYTI